MAISTQDARNVFTKALAAVYNERSTPTSFLRSLFPTVEKGTKEISIEVRRGYEKIAVDVTRGTDGNRNVFGRSTEKIFVPPLYDEYFDATQLDVYDKLFGDGEISVNRLTSFVETVSEKVGMLQDKIERAYELQCAQVLETGIVTLNKGTNIDFKRKAGSLVDKSGTPWTTGTNDPFADLLAGAQFIRTEGKASGGTMNVIMGSSALDAFLNNTIVKERADIRNYKLDDVTSPLRNGDGGAYHGRVSAGAWNFDIWSYPEYYTNSAGNATEYMNAKNVVILPENPMFRLTFAAVPQLVNGVGATTAGAYKFYDYMDERKATHDFGVKSAGVAIPVAVDQIYTAQVVA